MHFIRASDAMHGYRRAMARPDLNLLVALDVLLEEKSVARAARRLGLSPSAGSRTLARLRETTGDPLLVRAGRVLVETPRAKELRGRVAALVQEGEAVLRPVAEADARALERTFTLRTGDGFVETFGPALLRRVAAEAPRVRLRFLPKAARDSEPLRQGTVDLETGVVDRSTGPEVRAQALFRDRFVGVLRARHPLAKGRVTPARYAAARHVEVWQHVGAGQSAIDEALRAAGLERDVSVVAAGFASALALARASDLVASVPERHTGALRAGLTTFPLPFALPPLTVSMLWHPRLDADPGQRWLRRCVREACAGV